MTNSFVRVLLVEDNPADVVFVRIALEKDQVTELQVVAVERLSEGLEQIQHNHFDVILLDLGLPDSQGLNTFEQIRRVGRELPIVVLSELMDEEVATRAMQLGAQDYVVKGTAGWEAVSRSIRYAIERQRVQIALQESETRYHQVLDTMMEGCQIIDFSWRYVYVNDVVLKQGKYTSEELLHHTMMEMYPGIEQTELFVVLRQCMEERTPRRMENPFVFPDGSMSWFELSIQPTQEGIFILSTDITERKQAEQALEDNEKRFRAMIENGLDDISLIDAQGNLLWESPSVVRNLGYAPDEFIGRNIFEIMHPEDRDWTGDLFAKLVREPGSRQYGIFRIQHSNTSWRWVEAIVTNLLEEPSVRAVVVNYRDITERKQVEENLRQSEKRYQEIFEYSVEGIFQSTPSGQFLNVNPSMAHIYGYDSPREMIQSITDIAGQLYLKPDERRELVQLLQSKGTIENFETKDFRKDGTTIWTSTSARAVRDEQGNILWHEGFVHDITERKQAEEARNEAELRYRALFEQSHDAIFILEITGRHLAVNQRAVDMLGYSREELLNLSVNELSAESAQSQQILQKLVNGVRIPIYERLLRKKDGSSIPVEINVELVHDAHGNPLHIQSVVRDIADRRLAEIELQHRNDDLGLINAINEVIVQGGNLEAVINVLAKEMKRIFSSQGISIYMLNPDERSLVMQQYVLPSELTRKIEKLIGSTIPIIRIPIKEGGYFRRVLESRRGAITNDPKEIQIWMAEFVESTFLPSMARSAIRKLIPQIYKLLNIKSTIIIPLISNGKIIGLLDVSSSGLFSAEDLKRIENIGGQLTAAIQRQQANEKVQRSEEFLNSIQNALSASIAILDETGTIVRVNSAWRKFGDQNGLSHPESCIGLNYLDICDSASGPYSEEASVVAKAIRDVISGQRKKAWVEYACHSPEEKRWFVLNITKFEDGDKIWVVLAHENITERRQAQDRLQRSEAILAQAGKMAHLGAWEIEAYTLENLSDNALHWSDEVYRIFGYEPGGSEMTNDMFFKHVHPDDQQKVQRAMSQAIAEKKFYEVEHRIIRPDGVERIVEEHADLIFDEHGQLLQILGAVQDITERKKIEEDLKETSEQFRTLFEASPEAIMLVDPRGDWPILDCNAAAYTMNGYTRGEVVGQTVDIFNLTPGDAAGRAEYLEQVRKAGILRYDDLHRRKDGSVFPIEVSTSIVTLGGREVILGIDRDITERKKAEEALRQSEQRYRALFEDMPVAIWEEDFSEVKKHLDLLKEQGITDFRVYFESHPEVVIECDSKIRILDVNNAALRMYRANSKEQLLKSMGLGPSRAELAQVQEALISIAEGKLSHSWECSDETFAGEQIEINLAMSVSPGYEKDYSRVIVTTTDITQRKRAERELRASEERFRQLADNIQEVFWITDARSGEEIYASPASEKIWGRPLESLLHDPNAFIESVLPEDRPAVKRVLEIQRGGENTEMEYRITHPDGSVHWIWDRAFAIFDDSGKVVRLAGVAADISQRKQAEEALHTSELKYRNLVETSHELIWSIDGDGLFTYLNQASKQIYGYEPEELIGRSFFEVMDPNYYALDLEEFKKSIGDRDKFVDFETIVRHRDGRRVILSANSLVLRDDYKNVIGIVGTSRDITERKQNEVETRRHLAELEALYENGLAVGRLLEPQAIGERIIQTFSQYLSWHHVTIRLCKDNTDELELIAFHLPNMEDGIIADEAHRMKSHVSRVGQGISGWVVQTGSPIRTNNLSADPHYVKTYEDMQSGLYMPLKVGDRVIGVISVESEESNAFSEQDERLLATLANQAATAFENARLYQSAQQEIWDRRIAEDALRQSEEKYRRLARELEERVYERTAEVQDLYDNAPCGYHSLDQDGNIIRINQTELKWLGYTREEVLGHSIRDFITDESHNTFMESFPIFKQQGSMRDLELEMLRKDGSIFPTLISATAIYDKDGRYLTSRSTLFDDTDRKHALETLRLANSEMKRAMRMKDEFLASMSHELRTPLNAILGLSESLLEQTPGPINEKQQKYLGTVNESGRHLLELINDILDLAKIESGQIKLDPGRVNINTVCEASLRMIKQLAQKKNQTVEVEVQKEIEHIWADERRLKQMIVNLLSNAVKFTPEGGQLGLKVHVDPADALLLITVWDHGIGIREDDLKRLFQPFVQLDSSLSRASAGTGLGLALVAEMARLHGGSVSVSSQPGHGSEFTIILPWDPAVTTDTLDKLKITGKIPIIRSNAEDKPTILLVEDTDSVVLMLRDYLELSGYKVEIARDGLDSVSKSIALQPDLILMDVQMPGMDGLEATRRIRKEASLKNTPIIALTALAMPSDRERCLEAGMNDYLSKPINLRELVKTMLRHLPNSGTGKKS